MNGYHLKDQVLIITDTPGRQRYFRNTMKALS